MDTGRPAKQNTALGERAGQGLEAGTDLTGRDQLISNVLFNWAAHLVFIIAGFIMPRLINRRLGQETLGVWDFGWSLVSYFYLVDVGISGAVSRYVAKYRTTGDVLSLNQTISSGSCVLGVAGTVVLGLALAFSWLLPGLFGTRLGEYIHEAQWVVLFLGAGLAVQVALGAFGGVLSGCHQWALQNLVLSGWHVATMAGMILALCLGGRLTSLAAITFTGIFLTQVTTVVLAYRAVDHLQLRLSFVNGRTIKDLYVFGGKCLFPIVSRMLLNQTTSVIIVAYLGPAALALFTRPRSLVLHVDTLVQKMARTLTPAASSLQCSNNAEGIRELLMKSTRYSFCMVLPFALVMLFFGGTIIGLWMGPGYGEGFVPAILAVGFLVPISQTAAVKMLLGLNAHGRAGIADLVASLCGVVLTVVVLKFFRWGLASVALAVAIPLSFAYLIYVPFLASRRMGLDVWSYFTFTMIRPGVLVLPFAACLAVAKVVFGRHSLTGLMVGGGAGTCALAILYWRYVLPERVRAWVSHSYRKWPRAASSKAFSDPPSGCVDNR
jgi:O-antigen/teichoic acid export membrane protein